MRISSIGLIAAVSFGLAGCATNGLGVGIGSGYGYGGYGYDPYGYGYSPYGYSAYGYGPYGYNPYGGWYNGYYYPGTGGWVYDRDGRRHEITPQQQTFFTQLFEKYREAAKERRNGTDGSATTTSRVRQPARTRTIERTRRSSSVTQESPRAARRAARAAARDADD